jgi:hypothetical protein
MATTEFGPFIRMKPLARRKESANSRGCYGLRPPPRDAPAPNAH